MIHPQQYCPQVWHPSQTITAMGVVYMRDVCNPMRIGYAIRSSLSSKCTPCESASPMALKKARRTTLTIKDVQRSPVPSPCESASSFVRVQGTPFEVPKSFFQQMPQEIRDTVVHTSGGGSSVDTPIQLGGHTALQFQHLLSAFIKYPAIDPQQLTLEQIFSISELSCRYGLVDLKAWSIEVMTSRLNSPESPLRTASNQTFVRALRLALACGRPGLSSSIQAKWLTRLLWRELSPIPAILLADKYELRNLLGHAYFVHMAEVQDRILDYCSSSSASPLNQRQKTHLLAGHYSLSGTWKRLRITPLSFQQSPMCKTHKQCLAAWKMRWSVACGRPCSIPDVDVFRRLQFVEEVLKQDMLLQVCLSPGCRALALASISKRRTEISLNLHHHFDLA